MFYIISACLAGENCKYNGGNNRREEITAFLEDHPCQLICPECAGGLESPREPAEIIGGDGKDVLEGRAKVRNRSGKDVTDAFRQGAEISLSEVKRVYQAVMEKEFPEGEVPDLCAVLKAKSPSCGSGLIYDGTFSGRKIPGDGVTAALFRKNGIRVLTEEEFVLELEKNKG